MTDPTIILNRLRQAVRVVDAARVITGPSDKELNTEEWVELALSVCEFDSMAGELLK